MKISPIQMVELSFRRFFVEADFEHPPEPSAPVDAHALLDGVMLRTHVEYWKLDREDKRGTSYFVTLRVVIDNQADADPPAQRFSPYLLDVEAGATVVLTPGAERVGDPEDLVAVNGPALIWGSVRDQVAMMTSRMPAGMALLPSVHFMDLKKSRVAEAGSNAAPAQQPAEPPAPPRRARTRKS